MEIRMGWALAAGLVVGGAVGWWQLGHPGWQTMEQKVAAAEQAEATKGQRHASEPTLYRWRNGDGVLQLTDKPPKGRKYEKIRMREDQNIIPMSELASPRTRQTPN